MPKRLRKSKGDAPDIIISQRHRSDFDNHETNFQLGGSHCRLWRQLQIFEQKFDSQYQNFYELNHKRLIQKSLL